MPQEKINLDNITIVLIETLSSGNIGSIARAMKNMGFSDLRLVNPKSNHFDEQAKRLAHGSHDILENIKVFPCLEEAISDCPLLIATSHKTVRNTQKTFSAREIGQNIIPYCKNNKVAILFGREDHGLSNFDVNRCIWTINIPAARPYPSLNISQAVMLICYELFMFHTPEKVAFMPKLVPSYELDKFYEEVQKIIEMAGFRHKNNRPSVFTGALKRILGRTGLEHQDLKVLYKLFDQFRCIAKKSKMDNP